METWIDPRLGRPKLLLVDDQPMNIRVLHQLFRYDCDVHMATGGQQAIEVCKALLPDLILLDVVMEGLDGHEVCRRLKADPLTQDIPIIFLSANGEEEDEAIGLELGAVDYIGKPFNPKIVRARVKTHLTLKLQSDYLRSMAMLDGLTGVANRRKLENRLEAAWSHACREGDPLSLIMLDVDHFKSYNDHYGHQSGDQCLQQLATTLAATLTGPMTCWRVTAARSSPACCRIPTWPGPNGWRSGCWRRSPSCTSSTWLRRSAPVSACRWGLPPSWPQPR